MSRTTGRALLAASLITLLGALPASAQGSPQMVAEQTTYDAGDVAKGDVIEHDFILKNNGTTDLQVLSVKPACGCTTPGFDKIIPAGGTGKVTLKVDTARFKGQISKSASVTTNDPAQPNLRLVVNANVQTFIDVLPRDTVTFRQYRGEEKKQELTIRSNEEGEFTIKDVQVNGESIQHELNRTSANEYALSVWLDKAAPIGNVSGSLKLLTSSAKEPNVTLTVRGSVLGQISVNPSTLYFRVDGAAKEVKVSSDSLNMRERGELGAPVVAKLDQNAQLKVLETAGEWYKVRSPAGQEGWVFTKLVEPVASAASLQSKVLNVTHRQAGQFKITSTQVEGQKIEADALKIETETVREGASYRVTVTYEGGLDKGNYTGKVILGTSDSEEPSVEIPLYIVVT
jgi:biopolymer transport protein ExbD